MKFLSQLNLEDQMGKKAYNISLLKKAGVNVPDGFVISFAQPLDKDILLEYINSIGGFPVAVRSSGQVEDLVGASFAGLYETYLNIRTNEELLTAIEDCKKSLGAQRVDSYLRDKKISLTRKELEESFYIFIQKMVDSKISGVLFSIDPISGKEEELYTECCFGLGEKLVSGEVNPSKFKINYYSKKIVEVDHGGEGVDLVQSQIDQLILASLTCSSYFKMPQDIEYAFDDSGELWILQSRPITMINWRNDYGELTNADLKDGGVSSEVCTPFMFSAYEHCMDISLPQYFRDIKLLSGTEDFKATFHFYGKVYWSSGTVKKLLMSMPGFNEEHFDKDLGIFKDYGQSGPIMTKTSLSSIILGLKTLFYINIEFNNCFKMINNFSKFFESKNDHFNNLNFSKTRAHDYFEELINDFYIPTETSYFRVIYNNSNYQSLFKDYLMGLSKFLDAPIDCVNLMSNLGEVGHMKISSDLSLLKKTFDKFGIGSNEYKLARGEFLKEHYHHSDRELNLMVPRWAEVPNRIDDLVLMARELPMDLKNYFEEEKNLVIHRLKSKFFGRSKISKFLSKVYVMRSFLVKREQMRTYSTRAYYQLRIALLKLADELVEEKIIQNCEDIFFLPFHKIIKLIKNKNLEIADEIAVNRQFYYMYSDAHTPNDFGHKRSQIMTQDDPNVLRGIGCSKGRVEGVARVITDINQTHAVLEGEILITKFTDPGWTPVLGRVSAVVTEVGGILSHAAVISREYAIPAVLNCSQALSKIRTGDKIIVDGDSGIVIINRE